jgi:hypothetical protein
MRDTLEGGSTMEAHKRVVLAFVLIVSFSVPVEAQTTFTIFPGTRLCTAQIPHTAIFTRTVTLTAGTVNHFLTSGTSSGWFGHPDPVMMLVSPTGTIVAFNDDFVGLDSDILFTPTTTGTFRLIVHSFSTPSSGFRNVLFSVGGAAPTTLGAARRFGGTHALADWVAGTRFVTAGTSGDAVLLVLSGTGVGSQALFNDDVGSSSGPLPFPAGMMSTLDASITPPFSAHGGVNDNVSTRLIVGSFSSNTEGSTVACQLFRSWISPLLSPPGDAPTRAPVPNTPEMKQYLKEYSQMKARLTRMDPDERDRATLALQRRILPESQIRLLAAPASFPTAAYTRAQDQYLARVHARENELANLDHEQRSAVLEKMKAELVGRVLLQVEPDYGIPWQIDSSTTARPDSSR